MKILDGKEVLLLDVTPLSLGVETLGGVMTKLIKRNTPIPIRKRQFFSTAVDGQTAIDIKVYQGERELAENNLLLGQLRLDGIQPMPRGVPQIEVTLDIDDRGSLCIAAQDHVSGSRQEGIVHATNMLAREHVEELVCEAQQYAIQDRYHYELVDACNQADALIYWVEKSLRKLEHRIPDHERVRIESQVGQVRNCMQCGDLSRIRPTSEILQQMACVLCLYACPPRHCAD